MAQLDRTNDPKRRSWVTSANGHPDFPIQNLPLGIFSPPNRGAPRGGVAIGDQIVDIAGAAALFDGVAATAAQACGTPSLNALMALGPPAWSALRLSLGATRWAVIRQSLVENLLLGALSLMAGLAVAAGIAALLPRLLINQPAMLGDQSGPRLGGLGEAVPVAQEPRAGLLEQRLTGLQQGSQCLVLAHDWSPQAWPAR